MPYLHPVKDSEVLIVGGGLSGLTAAMELARAGRNVRLLERHSYPRHKVCGEYLSMEVLPLLKKHRVPLDDAPEISEFICCGPDGKTVETRLPLGGIGISRFALDQRMLEVAQSLGVDVVIDQAISLEKTDGRCIVKCKQETFQSPLLLAAWGKRSGMDREAHRSFWKRKSPWMAIKMHFDQVDFPEHRVGLYFFKGGYAGCSLTETGHLNFCCLIDKNLLKRLGGPGHAIRGMIDEHPGLRPLLQEAIPVFDKPLTIAEIDFGPKELYSAQGLYCGDAAHLIHPLCGNGMAMAVHSGSMAARLSLEYLEGKFSNTSELGKAYAQEWQDTFAERLRWGRYLQRFLTHPSGIQWRFGPTALPPFLLRSVIKKTHGKLLSA